MQEAKRPPLGPSQGASVGLVVNEWQCNNVGPAVGSLKERKLCLGWDVQCPAAPLWRHPPQLAARTC